MFTNYLSEQAQRRQIRSAFGQYLSPALVEQLAQSPEKLVLGGEQRDMTIMFSDVRGFTTISEIYKDDPQGLTALMNRFLTPLTNAIIDRKGTIDKYMGDAIMAFWNAPLDDPTHEINACEAALDMLDRVEALNREREAAAQEPTARRSSRSRSASASTPARAWSATWAPTCASTIRCWATASISPRGWKASASPTAFRSSSARGPRSIAKDKFAMLELDFIAVKGKKEPEVVYAIVGREDLANSGRFQRWRELNMKMLSRYRSRDWAGALGGDRAGPRRRRGEADSRRSTRSIPSASGRSRSRPRPTTGTAPTRWKPSSRS